MGHLTAPANYNQGEGDATLEQLRLSWMLSFSACRHIISLDSLVLHSTLLTILSIEDPKGVFNDDPQI